MMENMTTCDRRCVTYNNKSTEHYHQLCSFPQLYEVLLAASAHCLGLQPNTLLFWLSLNVLICPKCD